jgi:serine/threonine protein kinase/Tfp pilus assembly protein PilF
MADELRDQLQATLGDSYVLHAELTGAGMSRVFVAEDTDLHRKVVIKVLPPNMIGSLSAERFRREIQISAGLQHPCIVPLLATGVTGEAPFYTMPFVEGESLRAKLDRERKLSIADTIGIMRDVASALAYAQARGVVHRDLKPANILLSGGYALVADFGIAKALSASSASMRANEITETGLTLGTPTYMSPEQALADPKLDHRADIYALGVITYEMLAGRPPFHKKATRAVLSAHLFEKPLPINDLREGVPSAVAALVMRCLEKDPVNRPQSAREVLEVLDGPISGNFAAVEAPETARPSIAVLPFVNISADRENEYFSDGMTEEIINALSHLRTINVAARISSFAFREKNADLKTIGETLNVTSVLEGSVRKSGKRLRISAQLVNVADGYQIWSERYDRELSDVFELQDEIAASIANALAVALLPAEEAASKRRPTANIEAYELYLKGRYYWNQRGEGLKKGLEFFQLALAADPNYALAHVGIADSYNYLGYFDVLPPVQSFLVARKAILRALELDDKLAEAHAAMAAVKMCYDWDWQGAETEYTRALELDPEYVPAFVWFALLRLSFSRFEEGLVLARRAVEVDPLSGPARAFLGYFLHAANRHEEAIEQSQTAIELNPHAFFQHQVLGMSALALGRTEQAIVALQKAVALSVRLPWAVGSLAYAYGKTGKTEEARTLLQELLARMNSSYVPWSRLGLAYAGLGQTDDTLDCLESAVREREAWCANLLVEEAWAELRSHPRFTALVERVHFGGEHRDPAVAGEQASADELLSLT